MAKRYSELTRLSEDNYVKPPKTKSESLTLNELEDIFEDYTETPIDQISVGSYIKYFSKVNGKDKYRPGGKLINIKGLPNYVVLTNGKSTWSVQVQGTRFFKKMPLTEIKNEYNQIIDELEAENNTLKEKILKLETENQKLKILLNKN